MDKKVFEVKVNEFLKLLGDIKSKTTDERTALAILQEVMKDMRAERIHEERTNGHAADADGPATEKQIA